MSPITRPGSRPRGSSGSPDTAPRKPSRTCSAASAISPVPPVVVGPLEGLKTATTSSPGSATSKRPLKRRVSRHRTCAHLLSPNTRTGVDDWLRLPRPTTVRTDTLTMTSSAGRIPFVWVTRGSDRTTASTVAEARCAASPGTRPASRMLAAAAVATRHRAVPSSAKATALTQDRRRQRRCMRATPRPANPAADTARTTGRRDSMVATQIHPMRAGTRRRASIPGRSATSRPADVPAD